MIIASSVSSAQETALEGAEERRRRRRREEWEEERRQGWGQGTVKVGGGGNASYARGGMLDDYSMSGVASANHSNISNASIPSIYGTNTAGAGAATNNTTLTGPSAFLLNSGGAYSSPLVPSTPYNHNEEMSISHHHHHPPPAPPTTTTTTALPSTLPTLPRLHAALVARLNKALPPTTTTTTTTNNQTTLTPTATNALDEFAHLAESLIPQGTLKSSSSSASSSSDRDANTLSACALIDLAASYAA